ncbi:uncharacterized protein LOC118749467 [Rhagoletis pomonella]|uniref:uncharacterized protein LOC118749467 n=1 Tax=Rhagoletis pomonella TaxID=28610 RepID=UPI001781AB52|nr:uncharacterized protein LOC118749467 [Rhagoletis pomonella]
MSATSNEVRKRKRENEVKKWTEDEMKKVLSYMQGHRNIEKPTAQLYDKKLLEETKIDATWNMLNCKARHLKGTLQNVDGWSDSTAAGLGDDENLTTIRKKVLKKCPHLDQLFDIFSKSKEIEVVVMDTSTDVFDCSILDATDLEDESFPASDEPSTSSAATTFASKGKRREIFEKSRYNWKSKNLNGRNWLRSKN